MMESSLKGKFNLYYIYIETMGYSLKTIMIVFVCFQRFSESLEI